MGKIDGKYTILRKLGQGFGGAVYLVEANGEKVALKQLTLRPDHASLSSEEILNNFKEEFSTLKKLKHPHILRILDFGRDPENDFYYFTTEYIEGEDIFQATRGLSAEEIEELFVQILRGLSYLHNQKVYHFDIKPGNILVEKTNGKFKVAKLIDFGLAAFRKEGFLAGTPSYLAPESFMQGVKDGRADLYSLGVTWYTCLAGKNPFESEDVKQTLTMHRVWMPPPISEKIPTAPRYLDAVLEKLLQKNPAERYHRPDQAIRDLNWGGSKNYPLETEATALSYLPGEGQLVGRDHEWSKLLETFNRVFLKKEETKGCVSISGSHGVGKTRLLSELKYHAQLHTIPILDLRGSNPASLKSDALLLADDIDADALELARQFMKSFSTHAFMIVLAGEETPESDFLGTNLSLQNLKISDVEKYIASILGVQNPPSFLVEALFARTEGNPLFLTEMLQGLIRNQQIFDEKGRWSITHLEDLGVDFQNLTVSKNLSEYCESKFNRLDEKSKKLVASMAISRIIFDRIRLRKLGFDSDKDWESAEKEKLIRLDPITGQLSFLNPSFKDWLIKHLPTKDLSQLHQNLAENFREDPQYKEEVHYHLGFGTGSVAQRFQSLSEYGEILAKRCSWKEASQIFEVASQLALQSQDLVNVSLRHAQVLFRADRRAEAVSILEKTRETLKKEKENPEHWRWVQQTYREMASIYLKEGRFDLAREAVQASMVLMEEHQEDPIEKMILENFKAGILMREGKLMEALKTCERTYSEWGSLLEDQKGRVLNNELGNLYLAQGKYLEAKRFYQEVADFCKKIGNLSKQAYALYGGGESCYLLQEFQEAKTHYEMCAELSRQLKNEELLLHVYNGLGNLAYLQREYREAAKYYQEALELSQHSLDNNSTIGIAINLAAVLHLQGDAASALVYLNRVIETLEAQLPPSLHQVQFLVRAYLELGNLNLEGKQNLKARDVFRDAVRWIRVYPALEKYRFSAFRGVIESDIRLKEFLEAENYLQTLEKISLTGEQREELEALRGRLQPI